MSGRNIALMGVPRGGTTLACRLLGECDGTVSLFEPMDVATLDPGDRGGALSQVDRFYLAMRDSLLARGTAVSKHRDGQVPDNPFGSRRQHDGRRALQVMLGEIAIDPPAPGFTLVIKHNAAFCALLPEIADRFEAFAIVRNPLAVLASWNTVDLPVGEGRIPAGERLDPGLRECLDATGDRLRRQCIVLDWFFRRFGDALPPGRVLRYEDIVASGGRALRDRVGLSGPDRPDLTERNASRLYAGVDIARLADALERQAGTWSPWYARADIDAVAQRLLAGAGG